MFASAGLGWAEILALLVAVAAGATAIAAFLIRLYTGRAEKSTLVETAAKTATERQSLIDDAALKAKEIFEGSISNLRDDLKDARKELIDARREIAVLEERLRHISKDRDRERDALELQVTLLQEKVRYLETRVGGRRYSDPDNGESENGESDERRKT